jgi:hypothetical protein
MVWLQHVGMNMDNKERLFAEIGRVLQPRGRLSAYEVCSGSVSPPIYPVPWANDAMIDFLISPETFCRITNALGFESIVWNDVSADSLKWFKRAASGAAGRSAHKRPPPGIHLLMGETTTQKMSNMVRNLAEDRIRIVQGVFEKTHSPGPTP